MGNLVSTEWEVWQLWKFEINTNGHSRADYHCRGRCQDSSMLTYDAKTELKNKQMRRLMLRLWLRVAEIRQISRPQLLLKC